MNALTACTVVTIVDGTVYRIPPAPWPQWQGWNFERKAAWMQANASPRMTYAAAAKELSHRAALAREARRRKLQHVPAWIYQLLAYTGMRVMELRNLEWMDVDFEAACIRLHASGTKDREARNVPLHPMLMVTLSWRRTCADMADLTRRVVEFWPKRRTFWKDLARAGIDRHGVGGRVVHWHSFRKTFGTLASGAGVTQRVTQDVLGHSDPALTANIYQDVTQLNVGREVAKIPWLFSCQAQASQVGPQKPLNRSLRDVLAELVQIAQVSDKRDLTEAVSGSEWWAIQDSNL